MGEDLKLLSFLNNTELIKRISIFEKFMRTELEKYKDSIFYESLLYSLSGGKRIRPLILLLCSEIAGFPKQEPFSAALAIELIHTVSLVHDDIMDEEKERRGKPSYYLVYGLEQSLLFADFVLGIVLRLISRYNNNRIHVIISDTVKNMSEGQLYEFKIKNKESITEKEYFYIINKKTASLFESSARIGTLLSTDNEMYVEFISYFGKNLGIAYQIYDDILDWKNKEYIQKLNIENKLDYLKEKLFYHLNQAYKSLSKIPNNEIKNLLLEFVKIIIKI